MSTLEWLPAKSKCRHCKTGDVEYKDWESSDGGHTDIHYQCKSCKKDWWIEGADY